MFLTPLANIRRSCRCVSGTNALAYLVPPSVAKSKSLIMLTPEHRPTPEGDPEDAGQVSQRGRARTGGATTFAILTISIMTLCKMTP
jgi:hypothetical protein